MRDKIALAVVLSFVAACAHTEVAQDKTQIKPAAGAACENYGPQTPRGIASFRGENTVVFPIAPPSTEMNLCNIHFHNAAEHKAPAFSINAKTNGAGDNAGYQCGISQSLSSNELAPFQGNQCEGVQVGDTIEVHWVHSSCDVVPGPGLGSCLSEQCANPSLRVETLVFTVVNDRNALDFTDYTATFESNGYQQAKALPGDYGNPVQFLGSTTGPKYTEQQCSPLQVTWSVRPQCAKVDIASLSNWCAANPFDEAKAHGVRELVTNPKLLAPIR